nr:hypothetical protein [Tanacetum cinerariifolium]
MSSLTDSIRSGDGGIAASGSDGEGDLGLLRDEDGKSDGDGKDDDGKSGSGGEDNDGSDLILRIRYDDKQNEYPGTWCSSRKRHGTRCGHSDVTIKD